MYESGMGWCTSNRTYRRPLTSGVRVTLAGSPGPSLPPNKSTGLQRHFRLKVGLEFKISILPNQQNNSSPPTLTISMQIWTHYAMRPIFSKCGEVGTPRLSRGSSSVRPCLFDSKAIVRFEHFSISCTATCMPVAVTLMVKGLQ